MWSGLLVVPSDFAGVRAVTMEKYGQYRDKGTVLDDMLCGIAVISSTY